MPKRWCCRKRPTAFSFHPLWFETARIDLNDTEQGPSLLAGGKETLAQTEASPVHRVAFGARHSAVPIAVRSAEKQRTISRIFFSEMRERNAHLFFMPFHGLVTKAVTQLHMIQLYSRSATQ